MFQKIKQIKNSCSKSFMFTYFLIIMVILLPNALVMPSLSFKGTIITAIGIDEKDTNIEMSVLALSNTSKTNMSELTKVISGKGQTLANAVFDIETQIGRGIRMGHVGYIVISQSVANKDITKIINNLIITTKLPNTISLVISSNSAKEVLESASKLEKTSSYKFREMLQNEYNEDYSQETSLDTFLKGYYSFSGASNLGYVSLNKDFSSGIDSNGEQTSGQNGDTSSQKNSCENNKNSIISYKSEHAVFKKGIFNYILSQEEMQGLNFVVENNLQKIITLKDVNTQGLTNATITFDVLSEDIKTVAKIENNKPKLDYNISLKLKILEVLDNSGKRISEEKIVIDDEINQRINQYVKTHLSTLYKKLTSKKTDIINVYETFQSSCNKKFSNFLNTLKEKEDYLSYIQIFVQTKSKLSTN